MATYGYNLILALACVSTLMYGITCKPAKRSATDCYGTDCIIPQDELDFRGNPRDTKLLENITASLVHAFPEITDILKNMAYYTHQNTTVTTLPSILQTLEDEKDLQVTENLLIENVTAVFTPMLSEMVKLMQNQQVMQERHTQLLQTHTQLLQNQQAMQERHTQLLQNQQATQERHTQLLQNQQAMQERHNQLMEDQADRQSRLLENVTVLLQQSFPPMHTNISQMHTDKSQMHTDKSQMHTDKSQMHTDIPLQQHSCISGLSGQLTISPTNTVLGSFPVVCDMDTDGGRWIVFQRRFDGSIDFDRVWNDYVNGFGSLSGEFWLGLNKLYVITSHGRWELRVDLEEFDGDQAYAIYDNFRIGDSSSFYRLDIGSYSGTAGDSMRGQRNLNGMAFTTKDQDHDQGIANCAIYNRGGWWFNACTYANLNGLYLGQDGTGNRGMFWYKWKNSWQTLKKSELKIRLIEG